VTELEGPSDAGTAAPQRVRRGPLGGIVGPFNDPWQSIERHVPAGTAVTVEGRSVLVLQKIA
jgi:hypothetical protein